MKLLKAESLRKADGSIDTDAIQHASAILAGELPEFTEAQISKAHRRLQTAQIEAGLPVTIDKAALTGQQRDDLPDSAFAYIEPGGQKDSDGKTVPRKLRHFPIQDAEHVRAALSRIAQNAKFSEQAAPKVQAAAKKLGLDVSKADVQLERVVPLWKDDSKQIVYGVALTPGLRDSQGDIVEPEDIEKAAHAYLVNYRKHDVQHAEVVTGADGQAIAETVESFIAPQTMDIAGQKVLKGSWVLGVHINDPDTWQKVQKGELTGFSIGGSGERLPDEPGTLANPLIAVQAG